MLIGGTLGGSNPTVDVLGLPYILGAPGKGGLQQRGLQQRSSMETIELETPLLQTSLRNPGKRFQIVGASPIHGGSKYVNNTFFGP